ncbi:MAG: hypothetical protein ABIR15_13745 [Chitinophagaceae bacterium]
MPVKRAIPNSAGIYFITFTCYKWISLIDITNSYDLIYKWFDYLKQQDHFIIGYQIMPNHIHAIIAFRYTNKNINKIIGDGKRFIGYEIIKRLKQTGNIDLLLQLEQGVNKSDKKRGKLHEVWEDSFDWKECWSRDMILQKLNYMHANPCKGKWNLVESPVDYIHSSAKFYITGEQGIYPITNYMALDDIDLTQ